MPRNLLFAATVLTVVLTVPSLLADDPSPVVAEVGGHPITRAELEAFAAPQLIQVTRQRHQVLETGLAQLVETRLLEAEAARRGVSVAELLAAEVDAKIAPVTSADVDAWYTRNQARVRQPKEAVAGQIEELLRRERQAAVRQSFLDTVRTRVDVAVRLEPLRLEIDAADAPAKGPSSAPVTLVEYSDFQCPACRRVRPALDQLHEKYGDRLRIAFKQYPLRSIHPRAQQAAEAALCAGDQGRFWEMHDALFDHQGELGAKGLEARARELGLDAERFAACLADGTHEGTVQADVASGERLGVNSTPSLFVNGRPVTLLRGTPLADQLAAVIDEELERRDDR